ncbi:MAG: ABC transporter permease [Desulfurococcaceae archaeon]
MASTAFSTLLAREVKAYIRSPAFIATLALIGLFYAFFSYLGSSAASNVASALEGGRVPVCAVVEGTSPELLRALDIMNSTSRWDVAITSSDSGNPHCDFTIFLPGNLSSIMASNGLVTLNATVTQGDLSALKLSAVGGLVNRFVNDLRSAVAASLAGNASNAAAILNSTLSVSLTVNVRGRIVSYGELNALFSFSEVAGIAVAMLMGLNAGFVASSVAMEKAEKAFEMLLAQPIRRSTIVLAKLAGAFVASLMVMAVYAASIIVPALASGLPQSGGASPSAIGQAPDVGQLVALAPYVIVSMGLGILYSGSLAALLASIVSDERSAGVLSGPLVMVFIGAGVAQLFLGPSGDLVEAIVAGLTVSQVPGVAAYAMLMRDPSPLIASIAVLASTTSLAMALSFWMFNRDVVITGVRLPKPRR